MTDPKKCVYIFFRNPGSKKYGAGISETDTCLLRTGESIDEK